MAPKESEHSPEKMRQVARAMHQELEKLRAGSTGHAAEAVGRIGDWDVPTALSTKVDAAHQQMINGVMRFTAIYERLIHEINGSAQEFDLSELASRRTMEKAGGTIVPPPTRESQN